MGSRTLPDGIFLPSAKLPYDAQLNKAIVDMYRLLQRRINAEITTDTFVNRPATDGSNRFFFASDTITLYYDSPTGWVAVGGSGASALSHETPSGTINSSNLTFTITVNKAGFLVLNHVLMIEGTNFSRSTTTITYAAGEAPDPGDSHQYFYAA